MEFDSNLMGMIKTNTRGLFKETVENLTKDLPRGSYLVLRIRNMVPRVRSPIDIGYNYNARKVLYFMVIDNEVSTQTGPPYLSKHPDQFYNVYIHFVDCSLVVYKFFGSVNEVYSHNKSRQSDLVLDKFWVTHGGCLWLCTIVAMEIAITNLWKLFHYGIKRDDYEKLIGIREFSERLSLDCFKNIFQIILGPQKKNMPPLDKVNERETVSTFRAPHLSSSISSSTDVNTISNNNGIARK